MKQATRSGLTPLYRLHMHNKHVPIVRKGVLSDSVAVAVIRLNTGRLGPTTAHRPRHAVAANRPGRPGVERRGLSGKRRWLEEGGHRAKEWERSRAAEAGAAGDGARTAPRDQCKTRTLGSSSSSSSSFSGKLQARRLPFVRPSVCQVEGNTFTWLSSSCPPLNVHV